MEKKQPNVKKEWEVGQFVRTDETLYEITSIEKDENGNQTGFDMQEIGTIQPAPSDEATTQKEGK